MKKNIQKAQISIFIIIGAILLISSIILITTQRDKIPLFADQTASFKIKEYTQSCLEIQTEQALNQIALHGGWLYHPQMFLTDRTKPETYNQKAQGLNFLEKLEIPYWYYYDDASEKFTINIPPYDTNSQYSIKNQIKKHLNENLETECLRGFSSFEDQYNIEYNPKDTNTTITMEDKEIFILLNLPIKITEKNTNSTESISIFNTKTENKIRTPYLLARDITTAQINSSLLEKRILGMIQANQDETTRDNLPPFYKVSLTYDFNPWQIPQIKERIKQILTTYIGDIQFLNTNYQEKNLPQQLKNNEFAQKANSLYTSDYLSQNSQTDRGTFRQFQNYKVIPQYYNFFPLSLNIQPSIGNTILFPKPQTISSLLFPLSITEYTSVYKMTAPILLEIQDSKPGEDLIFNLAIETNINHNSPLKENYAIDLTQIDTESLRSTKTLICDPTQFISESITLNITDPINYGNREKTSDPITGVEGATISFNCKNIATCNIGETQINGKYITKNITELKIRLPINCNPGTLEIQKPGHQKLIFTDLNPTLTQPINLGEAEMSSEKNLDLKIGILKASDPSLSIGRPLTKQESGFLILENLENPDTTKAIKIDNENQYNLNISLLPGNYSIQGFILYNKSITIPGEEYCYDSEPLNPFNKEECTQLPQTNLSAWTNAGIDIGNKEDSTPFEITTSILIRRNKITINFLEYGIPKSYDELQTITQTMNQEKSKYPYLEE